MRLHPNFGKGGAAVFLPALTLLCNQHYAEGLVHQIAPGVPVAFVPLGAALLVGLAGFIMLYSDSPTAAAAPKA